MPDTLRLTPQQAKDLALKIEKALRDQGLNPLEVMGVLGAAFSSSLSDITPEQRQLAVKVHISMLHKTLEFIAAYEARERNQPLH